MKHNHPSKLINCLLSGLMLFGATGVAHGMAQRVSTFEIGIDAPWRIEPSTTEITSCNNKMGCIPSVGAVTHGAIPIQITVHDANSESFVNHHYFDADISVEDKRIPRQFLSVDVVEYSEDGQNEVRSTFLLNDLHEMERTLGTWLLSTPSHTDNHQLCRQWSGDDCEAQGMADLAETSEWHATLFYTPQLVQSPGANVRLKVELELLMSKTHLKQVFNPADQKYHTVELIPLIEPEVFAQHVNVHLGEDKLPKFDDRWAYGDLHYHSQGTDNDGETAYSYRGTLQAMSALGLDFLFATDHASNSEQLVQTSFVLSDALFALMTSGDLVTTLNEGIYEQFYGLRDMSPNRFSHHLDLINGYGGANSEVSSYARQDTVGKLSVPQIFLGAEVDVVPEVRANEEYIGPANGHRISEICSGIPNIAKYLYSGNLNYLAAEIDFNIFGAPNYSVCDIQHLVDLVDGGSDDPRWLIRDFQGKASTDYYARQHLLHLPGDPQRSDAFVKSNTSTYGGATRRLKDVIDYDYEGANKGYFFLAHPTKDTYGDHNGRLGPDILPFSEAQLKDAFKSQYMLGLEVWNEDVHLTSEIAPNATEHGSKQFDNYTEDDTKYRLVYTDGGEFIPVDDLQNWAYESTTSGYWSELQKGLRLWDQTLMWGLNPAQTAGLDWLASDEPRRIFIAGGSDSHGDFNYRREGYFFGTKETVDSAIGKPRNLLFTGSPQGDYQSSGFSSGQPYTQGQVLDALKSGNFSVTDGPALRMVFDMNRNSIIDDDDIPMGDIVDSNETGNYTALPLIVEWKSTPEFGKVKRIDLWVGGFSDHHEEGMVYAPWQGGIGLEDENTSLYTDPDSGREYRLDRSTGTWIDPEGSLRLIIADTEGYQGQQVINFRPAFYPVGSRRVEVTVNNGEKLWNDGRTPTTTQDGEIKPGSGFEPPLGSPSDEGVGLFEDPKTPDRMYVRATAIAKNFDGNIMDCRRLQGECINRWAYTNPVWIIPPQGILIDGEYAESDINPGQGTVIDGSFEMSDINPIQKAPVTYDTGITITVSDPVAQTESRR